jgi:hypothetical protein
MRTIIQEQIASFQQQIAKVRPLVDELRLVAQ